MGRAQPDQAVFAPSPSLLYSLRPWTRDPGQTVSQIYSLQPMSRLGDTDDFRLRFKEFTQY